MRSLAIYLALVGMLGMLVAAPAAFADDLRSYELVVENHVFQPETLILPAGERFKLIIKNRDDAPMEFESYELNREKVIVGESSAVIYLGPLEPGTYPFFDEFHRATATGTVVVKPQ